MNKQLKNLNKTTTTRDAKNGNGLKSILRKQFKNLISHAKNHLKKAKPKCKKIAAEIAIAAAKEFLKDYHVNTPRVIPVPKTGGVIPLIPIFAGLSAAGNLPRGAAGVSEIISELKVAKKHLQELKRCNESKKSICIGNGLHLKHHKDGLGIVIKKHKSKN